MTWCVYPIIVLLGVGRLQGFCRFIRRVINFWRDETGGDTLATDGHAHSLKLGLFCVVVLSSHWLSPRGKEKVGTRVLAPGMVIPRARGGLPNTPQPCAFRQPFSSRSRLKCVARQNAGPSPWWCLACSHMAPRWCNGNRYPQ